MIKRLFSLTAFVCCLFIAQANAGDWSNYQYAGLVQYNSANGNIYVRADAGNWATASCPNASWGLIESSDQQSTTIALIISSQSLHKRIRIYGECYNDNYLIVSNLQMID